MTKFIRYTAPDGTKADCVPVANARLVRYEVDGRKTVTPLFVLQRNPTAPLPKGVAYAESEDEFVSRIAAKDIPAGVRVIEILNSEES